MKKPNVFYVEDPFTGDLVVHKTNGTIGSYCNALRYIDIVRPKLQSDYCRYNAKMIAEMASRGHITCLNSNTRMASNRWWLTHEGRDLANSYCAYD